jgi:hypothetical protein
VAWLRRTPLAICGITLLSLAPVAGARTPGPPGPQNEPAQWAEFGVAIAATADTIFVAGNRIRNGMPGPGEVHVFELQDARWVPVRVLPVPEAIVQDTFAISMAAGEHTLVVGAQFADQKGEDSGLAYVFERLNGEWDRVAVLTPSDAAAGDQFGLTVSLSGDTIVVGARLADLPPRHDCGAAYVFTRERGAWTERRKLTASDAASNDLFGRAGLDGHALIVSADLNDDRGFNAGKAYAFENRAGTWVETGRFTASDGRDGDEFGLSVALAADTAVFGAVGADGHSAHSGAAYVFERRDGTWREAARLTASDGTTHHAFGSAVAVQEDTIVVGAPADRGAAEHAGAVYVFERHADGWRETAKLVASDAVSSTWFGNTIALSGHRIVAGVLLNGKGQRPGAAYVFERNQGTWRQVDRLTPKH